MRALPRLRSPTPPEGLERRLKNACNDYLVLRNHGLLTVGRSIPEAFMAMYLLESACQIQISAQAGGDLLPVRRGVLDGVANAVRIMEASAEQPRDALAWPALLRRLDRLNPGYDE